MKIFTVIWNTIQILLAFITTYVYTSFICILFKTNSTSQAILGIVAYIVLTFMYYCDLKQTEK